MSRLRNLFNNLEYFEEPDPNSATENTKQVATDSDIPSTDALELSAESPTLSTDALELSAESPSLSTEGDEVSGKQKNQGKIDLESDLEQTPKEPESESEKLLKAIASEDASSMDFDEQDDDELEEETVENQANELTEEDEMDDDDLTDEDVDALINSKFVDNEKDDEIDPEVFVPPVIDLSKRNLDPGFDEKLTDMTIDDDDTDENLFKQGGANGERAEAYVGQVNDDGDELAQLIMEVPITIITTLMEITMNLVMTVIIGPFAEGLQNILEPIRNVLVKLYSIVTPLVLLINNLINLPFSIGTLAWAVICNAMKLFGVSMKCSRKQKKNDLIKSIYDETTAIDILRPADIIFKDDIKQKFMASVKTFFERIISTIALVIKIIPVILSIIEFIINVIKETISIITEVTDGQNIKNLIIIIVMLGIGYLSLFGLSSVIKYYKIITEKFS
jgi:hypothetical protein